MKNFLAGLSRTTRLTRRTNRQTWGNIANYCGIIWMEMSNSRSKRFTPSRILLMNWGIHLDCCRYEFSCSQKSTLLTCEHITFTFFFPLKNLFDELFDEDIISESALRKWKADASRPKEESKGELLPRLTSKRLLR